MDATPPNYPKRASVAKVADMANETGPDVVTIIVNPRAGRGRSARILPRVIAKLHAGLPRTQVRVIRTRSYADAQERAASFVRHSPRPPDGQRPNVLVVMGGDGMANLGLNACAGSRVQLAVVPAGTGDDFARGTGIPRRPLKAVEAIVQGYHRPLDVLEVSGGPTGDYRRLVGSVVSSGYDAKVNVRVNDGVLHLGSVSYFAAALTEIAKWQPVHYRVNIDGQQRNFEAILVAVGNAGYVGGGIPLCPRADPSDGMLDVTIVHPVRRRDFVRMLPTIYDGRFSEHPMVEVLRATTVDLAGEGLIPMADGETLAGAPLRLTCEPAALHLIVDQAHADE